MNKKVLLGMSGGVDSSVSALLLKKQGYEVIGCTMILWENANTEKSINDAKKVCEKLDIEHHTYDLKNEFKKNVIDYFINEYKNARTPNPCVECNKFMKFGEFYKIAKTLSCDYIATGHYARIVNGELYRGIDNNKDQTYFLSQLSKEQLKNVLFPIGELNKTEVRKIAEEYGLVTAQKKDSTGICFIGERNFTKFLENYLPNQPGDILDIKTKEKVGEHIGLMYYTIGQRRGLNIGGSKERMFVVGKDLNKNILYISYGDTDYLVSDACIIDQVNFNSDVKPEKCSAKFRYRQPDNEVSLTYLDNGEILVSYPQGVKSVTPGQACVLYLGEQCLGGGIIKEVRKQGKKLWYL